MTIRPPHVGWLIVLGLTCAILLAAGSSIYGYRTHQKARVVNATLDSLGQIRCVPIR